MLDYRYYGTKTIQNFIMQGPYVLAIIDYSSHIMNDFYNDTESPQFGVPAKKTNRSDRHGPAREYNKPNIR